MTRYEVTWMSGHVEYIECDHVLVPEDRYEFRANVDGGRTRLILSVKHEVILSIRDQAEERIS